MKLTELIDSRIDSRLDAIWTAMLAKVEQVNLTTMRCDVKPKMKIDNPQTGGTEEMPILKDVPIMFQKSAGSTMFSPPEIGDVVLILFSKYALDRLLKDTQIIDHGDVRRFSIDDAIVIGGLLLSTDTIPAMAKGDIFIQHKSGSGIRFLANGNIEITANRIDFIEM